MKHKWRKAAAFIMALMLVAAPLTQAGNKGGLFGAATIIANASTTTNVTLDKTTAQTVTVGDKVAFTATVAPDDATDKTVKWSASNANVKLYSDEACTTEVGTDATDVLTVYAKGITAGSATVTAASNADATKTASCDVTVNSAATTLTLTGLDGAVIVDSGSNALDADATGKYTLNGASTYTLYTNKSVYGADETGSIASLNGQNQTYNGSSYKYKYALTIPATPAETGYTLSHEHATQAHSNNAGDGVYVECSGEDNSQTNVAWFDTDDTYYYGSYPTKSDIKTQDALGATADVTEFYFSEEGSTVTLTPEELQLDHNYVIHARVAVTLPGKTTPDYFSIKRNVSFAARPLTDCDIYYTVDGGEEIPVDKATWDAENNTYNVFDIAAYDGNEHEIAIIVKNPVMGEIVKAESEYKRYTDVENDAHFANKATDADWYWTGFSAPETVGEDANNYTGSFSVSWSVAKADADIQITAKDGIVYDGAELDESDFIFEGDNADLVTNKTNFPGTTVSITGGDITNAGNTTVDFALTFDNYNDINVSIPATINKRSVKVTPDDDQSMIYGTEEAPVISVTTEKAKDADGDGEWDTKTGVIPADAGAVDFSPAVDITDFDYTYFVNDSGTYSYKISDAVLDNYTAVLDGTAFFIIEPKQLTADMFTVDEVDYTFDGTQKDAPYYTFSDGRFSDRRTNKLTDEDFTEGGTDHALLPGTYTLEFSGQGNYKGIVAFDWEIKPIQEYSIFASVEDKTYDGMPVVPTSYIYRTDDANRTEVTTIKGVKTTYTYYSVDGDELTKLDGAPKDAGFYRLEVSKTAKGYTFDNYYVDFTISQKEIAVTPNAVSKIFGEADPDLTDFSYDGNAIADGDTLTFTGKYALPDYEGNVGTYPFDLGTIAVDSDNYFLSIAGAYTVEPQELTDVNIIVYKDCTITEDGWWYPGDCIKVTGTVGGEEIELVRPVYDPDTNTYINTDFEFISATKTKKTGSFSVQIQGIGNYTGYAEGTVNVRNADYDHQAAIEAGISVDLADAVLKDGTKARFVLTPTLADGWTVEAYGIIYDKTGAVKNAKAAKTGLVLGGSYVTKTCSTTSGTAYALNITPTNNNTIWAVGYITVSNGAMSTTIYTEPRSGNVEALIAATEADIEANVNVNLADAVLKDSTKARFVLTPEIADGWTVDAYGIVYDKSGAIKDADAAKSGLVLGGSYVTKTCSTKDGTAYALNITPANGNTIWAVGYITVTKNGITKTIYTEPKSSNVTELQIEANVSVTLADAVKKDGTKARFVLTPEIADGWTVDAYGIIYDKTGAIADEEAAKSGLVLGGSYVTKKCSTTDGTAYALNITPTDDNTIWAVGYITVTKDGMTKTIYTAPKSAKVSELV